MRGLPGRVVEIHRAFDRAAIPHAFGGAIAYAYHGEPRATRDIDLNVFLPATQPSAALEVVKALGITVDVDSAAERIRRDAQVRLRWGTIPVDLFFSALEFHDQCRIRALRVPFAADEIPILSAEDLAICKVAFDRDKDWIDLREMIAMQGERFERSYALRWLDDLLGSDDRRTIRFRQLLESGGS